MPKRMAAPLRRSRHLQRPGPQGRRKTTIAKTAARRPERPRGPGPGAGKSWRSRIGHRGDARRRPPSARAGRLAPGLYRRGEPEPHHRLAVGPARTTGRRRRIADDVFDGDLRLMRVTADQYRGDLKQSGIGDGRHAFVVPLRPELLRNTRNVFHPADRRHGCRIAGITGDDRSRDAGPPRGRRAATKPLRRMPPSRRPSVRRRLTENRRTRKGSSPGQRRLHRPQTDRPARRRGRVGLTPKMPIRVLQHDRLRRPDRDRRLDLEPGRPGEAGRPSNCSIGDQLLTTVLADQYLGDLMQSGFGDGRYGFRSRSARRCCPMPAMCCICGRPVRRRICRNSRSC